MWQIGGVGGAHRDLAGRHTAAGTSNGVTEGVIAITPGVRNHRPGGFLRSCDSCATRNSEGPAGPSLSSTRS